MRGFSFVGFCMNFLDSNLQAALIMLKQSISNFTSPLGGGDLLLNRTGSVV